MDLARAVLRVRDLLNDAEGMQWDRPPRVKPRDDDGPSAGQGGHSDPTASTALNDRRLALRGAVRDAEVALAGAVAVLRRSEDGLASALDEFVEEIGRAHV